MPYGLWIGNFNTACMLKQNSEGGGCMRLLSVQFSAVSACMCPLALLACVCKCPCPGAGQCVAAFDHFCPLLATAVGDMNRARFW